MNDLYNKIDNLKTFTTYDKKLKESDDTYKNDLESERILFLSEEIDDDNIENIIVQLLKLDRISNEDIILFINSSGGKISSGLALYDIMNLIKSDIITICTGQCASMGAILFINGTKGKRYMLPNSNIMIHQVISDISGKYIELEQNVKKMKNTNDLLLKIIAEKTGTSLDTIKNDVSCADKWFDTAAAIEYGLADKVIYSIDEIYK